MLILVKREDAQLFHLPGRVWGLLLGPDNVQSVNASLGFATFPAGSSAAGHIHETTEEYIYVVSGRGGFVSDANTVLVGAGGAGVAYRVERARGRCFHLCVRRPSTAPTESWRRGRAQASQRVGREVPGRASGAPNAIASRINT